MPRPRHVSSHIAAMKTSGVRLSLETADLCCVVLLEAAEVDSASLAEEEALDLLTRIHEQFPGSENPRKRATHGLQRLREQRLLVRVDAAGFSEKGEYTLSSLGRSIVTFFAEDEVLTRESLTILTATLHAQLLAARDQASLASPAARYLAWHREHVFRAARGDGPPGIGSPGAARIRDQKKEPA